MAMSRHTYPSDGKDQAGRWQKNWGSPVGARLEGRGGGKEREKRD